MPFFGCHLSSTGGFLQMGKTALRLNADTFQFFTRNPRGGNAKKLDEADVLALRALMKEKHFGSIVAHAPYTVNPCSDQESVRDFAERTMRDDLTRLSYLPEALYNFHPGSHVGQGRETGIQMISDLLNRVMSSEQETVILLETMAGKGSEIGGSFEELREILSRTAYPEYVGVCLDTCHVFDAGYDIVGDPDSVLTKFDKTVGLKRLRAIHLNDSRNPLGSHKDRHERLGAGSIGLEAIRRLVTHPTLRELPMILETPNEPEGYAQEIEILREMQIG